MEPLLSVEGLSVEAGVPGVRGAVVPIVTDVSFQLQRGAVCGLLGGTGSGKSVLARSLLGISAVRPGYVSGEAWFRPEEGSAPISLFGVDTQGPRPGWAGYVFQDPVAALDPLRRVIDQVADSVAIRHKGLTSKERKGRARDWLAQVQLSDPDRNGQMYPFELSGGMAQRVCAAVALAAEPQLLVADEPTSGLDWSLRREIVELLGDQCNAHGMTLLLISHDIQVVRHLAEQVLVMKAGRVVNQGTFSSVFPPPKEHSYTGELQVWSDALCDDEELPPRRAAANNPRGIRLLRARGIQRSFPAPVPGEQPILAVDRVDLDIYAGEMVALVGESGSGKTTLGKLLLHILTPEAGELGFDGYNLRALDTEPLRALRAQMQFSYQQASGALNPRLSIESHLAETVALHRSDDLANTDLLIEEYLKLFALEGKGAFKPSQLSGGERRRAALARVILPAPMLLVLDEPTAGLDASVKGQVVEILRGRLNDERAVLLISHELDLIQRVADRVAVMYQGRIVEEMPAQWLDPLAGGADLHPYTDQLLASSFRSPRRLEVPRRAKAGEGGCPFRHRCHRVEPGSQQWQQCTDSEPSLVQPDSDGHRIACHLAGQAVATESR
jgi:peptide/nickel transport system ATP-binding protein